MASRFATVSKDEILAVNEAAAPTNTKKETKFGLSVFTGRWKKIFLLNLQQNDKKWSPKHCQLKRKHTLTNWRLLLTEISFLIFTQPIW